MTEPIEVGLEEVESFHGEIFVSSSIVDYLSSGLYRSPAACLKELVNNSYDADATGVRVFVRPDANRIIIADDGTGFSKAEFQRHFSRISESFKRDESEQTDRGRPKIGKIGIGFIAANEICDEMRVLSTKSGSTDLLDVSIDFAKMRLPKEQRRGADGQLAKADYVGSIRRTARADHYTQIFLNKIRDENQAILAGAVSQSGVRLESSLYGLAAASVRDILCRQDFRAWSDFDSYSETMLRVGLNVPVQYHDHWMEPVNAKVNDLTKEVRDLGFTVSYDGADLRKPTVFCSTERGHFVDRFEYEGTNVSAKGYFYAQHGTIWPQDLNGLLIRIRNSAVGEYDQTFWDFPNSIGPLFQRWVSAEIWASDQLEDAMNIDRRTLRVAHPAYEELRTAMHKSLRAVLTRARSELHGEGADERRHRQATRRSAAISSVARRYLAPVDKDAARALVRSWTATRADDIDLDRALVQRYDVAELYAVVLDVARETLPSDQLASFVSALTTRLRSRK
jgi:hypothetical protein